MNVRTQCQAIANHLRSGKSLTPLDGLKLCGTLRLSARIYDLKRSGMEIGQIRVKRNGKSVAKYYAV